MKQQPQQCYLRQNEGERKEDDCQPKLNKKNGKGECNRPVTTGLEEGGVGFDHKKVSLEVLHHPSVIAHT